MGLCSDAWATESNLVWGQARMHGQPQRSQLTAQYALCNRYACKMCVCRLYIPATLSPLPPHLL